MKKKLKKAHFNGKIDIEFILNNGYISIKLKDNGTGILDTTKVMTPYFTTKKTGTGLGLPIVKKIITEHSGEINLSSKNKEGTEITIIFPIINE